MEQTKLYVVIPCYNEEQVLPITSKLFLEELKDLIQKGKISEDSRILFVNDGSKDRTWEIITQLSQQDEHFEGISQSRNRGHQNAVLAGLMEAKDLADITISIDSFFKRFTAESFYKLLNGMGVESVYNHADYRLVSSKVLQEFANFKEVNLFLRGMFPLVGFKSTCVYYERHERMAGESHYPLSKMLALAFDGITSLSIKPIRMIYRNGNYCFTHQLYRRDLGSDTGSHRSHCCRLDQYGMHHLFYGRYPADLPGCIGRIYWKDLSGGKGTSPLYHQRAYL